MWWRTSNCSPLLIYRPRKDERLSWPGWLTYSRWLTHISGHPSATGRAQDGKELWPETDVLPLSHADQMTANGLQDISDNLKGNRTEGFN